MPTTPNVMLEGSRKAFQIRDCAVPLLDASIHAARQAAPDKQCGRSAQVAGVRVRASGIKSQERIRIL